MGCPAKGVIKLHLRSAAGRYLYIAIVYNVAYTVALYALLLFYFGCEELLEVRWRFVRGPASRCVHAP